MAPRTSIFSLCLLLSLASAIASGESSPPPPAEAPITSLDALIERGGAGAFDDNPDDFDCIKYLLDRVDLPARDAVFSGSPFTLFVPNDGAITQTAIDFKYVAAGASEGTATRALVAELERKAY